MQTNMTEKMEMDGNGIDDHTISGLVAKKAPHRTAYSIQSAVFSPSGTGVGYDATGVG